MAIRGTSQCYRGPLKPYEVFFYEMVGVHVVIHTFAN